MLDKLPQHGGSVSRLASRHKDGEQVAQDAKNTQISSLQILLRVYSIMSLSRGINNHINSKWLPLVKHKMEPLLIL